jgi:hypothetical protein
MFLLHKITFLFTLNNKHCCLLQMHDDDADVTTTKNCHQVLSLVASMVDSAF